MNGEIMTPKLNIPIKRETEQEVSCAYLSMNISKVSNICDPAASSLICSSNYSCCSMREPSATVGPRDRTLTVSWNHFILTFQVKQRRRYERRDPKEERSWADTERIQKL